MRLPKINWAKAAESLAAADPYVYTAMLMADGSIRTGAGEKLVAAPETTDATDRRERYEAWCRRAGRSVHPDQEALDRRGPRATALA